MKDVATTCILRAVNASKYVRGRGSTRTPLGKLIALSRTLAGFGEGEGKGRRKRVGERGKVGSPSKSPG